MACTLDNGIDIISICEAIVGEERRSNSIWSSYLSLSWVQQVKRTTLLCRGGCFWLLSELPVWEHVLKKKFPWGPRKRLLVLPLFYQCRCTLPGPWLWYYLHQSKLLWSQGSRSFLCSCWHQNLLWDMIKSFFF